MNKHTRLAVGILVLVLVLLILATVSFSVNISKKSAGSQNSTFDTGTNSNGNVIVEGDDHLYGVSDAAGNLILEPEWKELHFIGSDYLSAVQENADSNCVGVLDLDGNVVAPFVYDHVEVLTDSYYLAVLAENQQVVLYDHDFRAADAMVWDSSTWEKPLLTVTSGEDSFQFSLEKEILQLVQCDLARKTEKISFSVHAEKVHAGLLLPEEWSGSADQTAAFLDMVKTQDFSKLQDLTGQDHENAVLGNIAPADARVTRMDSDVYLQAKQNETGQLILTWQIGLTLRNAENASENKTLTFKMEKNGKETWVITEAKLS